MSEPFVEILPATKSSKRNGIRWEPSDRPGEGVLVVEMGRTSRTVYHVREEQTAWDGRAFRLDVIRGGTDSESEFYHVFIANNPQDRSCECRGFHFTGHCKHLSAVIDGLLFNNWI
jgi:hypothetical protein